MAGTSAASKVLTDANGVFELLTLPSELGNPDDALRGSAAGLHGGPHPEARHRASRGTSLVQSQDVTCGERMKVGGTLL